MALHRTVRTGVLILGAAAGLARIGVAQVPAPRAQPAALSDAEFWRIFASMSEPPGTFSSDNFVSNEIGMQQVIPALIRSTTPGGVYLGVGPEQNFTYIANLQPSLAIIVDVRRQNAMLHLMYKAVFEMSPTRADFVARLFSRTLTGPVARDASAEAIFTAVLHGTVKEGQEFAAGTDSLIAVLTEGHGFALPLFDQGTLGIVYRVFRDAGPVINYSWRFQNGQGVSSMPSTYATFAALQTQLTVDGRNLAFLASDELYQRVRALQRDNLIIPVVGNFAGSTAIRAVAAYLRQRRATVMAFYLSNVEQYLWERAGAAEQFYANVAELPLDTASTFIRSFGRTGPSVAPLTGSVRRIPAADNDPRSIVRIDSTGRFTLVRDSLGRAQAPAPPDPLRSLGADLLTSGLASMASTVAALRAGTLVNYQSILAMTNKYPRT